MGKNVHDQSSPFAHPNESAKSDIVNEHPNESGEGCGGKFAEWDHKKFKPFFIHNYSEELIEKADAFDEEIIRQRSEKDQILDAIGENLKKKMQDSMKKKLAAMSADGGGINLGSLIQKKE